MKAIISTALLTVLTASAAHAEGLQLETRAFHANMRLDSGKTTYIVDGESPETGRVSESFFNTAGFGVSAVQTIDDVLDFGLGLSFARYYPNDGVQIDQTVLNGFSRINLAKTETARFYMLAGLSRQQLAQEIESDDYSSYKSSFTPIVNGDLGLGGSIKLGSADLGLEYKYSSTLARGRASLKSFYSYTTLVGTERSREKVKIKDIVLEGQELALTLGVKI